jgi:hypothetical protein
MEGMIVAKVLMSSSITSIFRKPLIHVRVAFIQVVVQIIKVIPHPERVLLIVPHECMVETEL